MVFEATIITLAPTIAAIAIFPTSPIITAVAVTAPPTATPTATGCSITATC